MGERYTASAEREESERRGRTRRRRTLAGVLLVATLVSAVFAIVAFTQRTRADREADRAESRALAAAAQSVRADREAELAEARALAASALSLLESDPELAVLLAARAVEADPETPTHLTTLHEALRGEARHDGQDRRVGTRAI